MTFVVSDDLTGGDPSKIVIWQNGKAIFQDGVTGGTSWTVIQYVGDTAASPANPTMTYWMLWRSVSVSQNFQIIISK